MFVLEDITQLMYFKGEHMRTIFNWSIILAFLLIGFSVFYYLVIFLPNQAQQKVEQQKKEQELKNQLFLFNNKALDSCLQDVNSRQQTAVQDPKFKNLSREDLKILLDQFSKQKDECYKRYPQ